MIALAPPPQFTPPAIVTRAAVADAGPPAVAVDDRGRTLLAWTDRAPRVVVRRGAAGPKQTLSRSGSTEPTVALAPDGSAAAIWVRRVKRGRRLIEVATAPPGGRFGKPQQLVSVVANVVATQVLEAGGRFVAVWWQGVPGNDHAVRYAVSSDGVFAAAQTLAKVDGNGAVSAAADPAGNVVATWGGPIDQGGEPAAAVLTPAATRFGPPQNVAPGEMVWLPQAFSGPGGAAVAFPIRGGGLRVAALGTDLGFPAPATIATVANNRSGTLQLDGPQLALPAGGAVAAWGVGRMRNAEDETIVAGRVDAAVRQPDGTFSAPSRLTPGQEFPDGPIATAATRTAALILWPSRRRVRYVIHTAAGFSPARTLTGRATRGVSIAAAGDHAVAAWQSGRTIRLARFGA